MSNERAYTVDQIRRAFWKVFHQSGELFFNYLGTPAENEACTQDGFEDFQEAL